MPLQKRTIRIVETRNCLKNTDDDKGYDYGYINFR